MKTYQCYAQLCWEYFNTPQAYYWMRISYANHARLHHARQEP